MEVFTLKSKYIIIAFNNQKKKTINYFLIIETSNNQEKYIYVQNNRLRQFYITYELLSYIAEKYAKKKG